MNDSREIAFDTATRIAASDDGTTYDNVAIALHWATALLVVIQFTLAQTWDWFAKPTHKLMEDAHMSFGVLLTMVIVARIIWRWIPGHQVSSLHAGWVRLASNGTHYLLTYCWYPKRRLASHFAGEPAARWNSSASVFRP